MGGARTSNGEWGEEIARSSRQGCYTFFSVPLFSILQRFLPFHPHDTFILRVSGPSEISLPWKRHESDHRFTEFMLFRVHLTTRDTSFDFDFVLVTITSSKIFRISFSIFIFLFKYIMLLVIS